MQYIRDAGFRYLDYDFGLDYADHSGVYADDWKGFLSRVKEKSDALGTTFIQAHAPMGAPIAADNAAEGSEEPITYADEFDRMAKEAALSLAREQPAARIEAPLQEMAPSIPENAAQVATAPPVAAPAEQPRRGRPSKAAMESSGNASPTRPAPAAQVANEAPMFEDFPDMTDDDPFL